jgi:hypothetical protein
MNVGAVIRTALRSLVNDRCYPNAFPQEDIAVPGTTVQATNKPTWPAIRYTLTDAQTDPTVYGTDTVDSDNSTVQIDVVALTYGAMISLRDQVIVAMMTTDPPCTREGYTELKDAETKTHRGILTYQFHASTPGGVSP